LALLYVSRILFAVSQLQRRVRDSARRRFVRHGASTVRQFNLLSSSSDRASTTSTLAKQMAIERTTLTRNLR
jgi:hypothetical protein